MNETCSFVNFYGHDFILGFPPCRAGSETRQGAGGLFSQGRSPATGYLLPELRPGVQRQNDKPDGELAGG